MNNSMKRDSFYCGFSRINEGDNYSSFMKTQKELEDNGKWVPSVVTKRLSLMPITTLEASIVANKLRSDNLILNRNEDAVSDEMLFDTATGTGLIAVMNSHAYGLRPTAISGLHNAAGLMGSAFARMEKTIEAEVLQHGLDVSPRSSLVLMRGDKIAAIHSDKYVILPISSAIEETSKLVTANFGELVFDCGSVSHAKTTARWLLKGAQQKLMQQYQDALMVSGVCINQDWMPVLDFVSSDTADSAMRLVPGFMNLATGDIFRFTEGIAVEHKRVKDKSGKEGLELFLDKVGALWSLWEDGAKKIEEMASFTLQHPENTLIELSIKVGISKKYAVKCLEMLERIMVNAPVVTMHEVYLCLSMAPRFAKETATPLSPPSPSLLVGLQEAVGKILTIPQKEWGMYDVAGHSGWKN